MSTHCFIKSRLDIMHFLKFCKQLLVFVNFGAGHFPFDVTLHGTCLETVNNIVKTFPCNIQRCFSAVKFENVTTKILVFFLFLLKTYINRGYML